MLCASNPKTGHADGMCRRPKTEIRTADFTDFTDDKRVSFAAWASDSSGRFRLQVLGYPRHPRHPRFQLRNSGLAQIEPRLRQPRSAVSKMIWATHPKVALVKRRIDF